MDIKKSAALRKTAMRVLAGLALAAAAGCGSLSDVELSPEDEADVMRTALRIGGLKSDVTVADVNGNGVLDMYIVRLTDKEITPKERERMLAYVTGAVAEVADDMAFPLDRVYVQMGDEIVTALVSDCQRCYRAGRNEFEQCMDESWAPAKLVEGE